MTTTYLRNTHSKLIWIPVLAVLASACGGDSGTPPVDPTFDLVVTVTATGDTLDGSYILVVDGADSTVATAGTPTTLSSAEPDTVSVELAGVAPNCTVVGTNPVLAEVVESTQSLGFDVSCRAALLDRIVFDSNRAGNRELYVMRPDGTGLVRLTDHPDVDRRPHVSPDGTMIVFESNRDALGGVKQFDIFVMSVAGGLATNITNNAALDAGAVWSPDGAKIAFQTTRDANSEIYTVNPDGTGLGRLTNDPLPDRDATWSPDGLTIAFTRGDMTVGFPNLFVISSNGTGLAQLTSNNTDYQPAYSPDGISIAFATSRYDAGSQLALTNAGATAVTQLTNLPALNFTPAWSPDGQLIVFMSVDTIQTPTIFRIGADGSGVLALTDNAGADRNPKWTNK